MTELMRRRRALMAAQGGDWKSDYVQDGILMWLDGEHNSIDGSHDPNLTVWCDQSGNGYDWNMGGTFDVKTKSVKVAGSGYGSLVSASLPKGAYIEIVVLCSQLSTSTSDAQSILNGYGNVNEYPRAVYINNNSYDTSKNRLVFGYNTKSKGVVLPELDKPFYCNSELYVNNQKESNVLGYQSWSVTGKWLFTYKSAYRFHGELFALRIYNRVLTEAEILRNFAADQKRFGIEVSV